MLAVAAAPRAWAAVADQGLFWPDEFFQSIEPAHRFAFGYGLVTWEWVEGARSWLYPGAIGLLWKAMTAAGVHDGATLLIAAKLAMVAVATLGVDVTMRLARRLGAGEPAVVLAGVASAMFPALVLFGSKCMTETVSAPLLGLAALLALDRRPTHLLAAGAVAALSIFVRYQNGIFALGLFALVVSERRWKDAGLFAVAGAIVGVAGGMLDAATWGTPFHSFVQYTRFHAEGRSAPWGTSETLYYVRTTWSSCGPAILVVLVGLAAATTRVWRHLVLVLLYFLAHTAIGHKEYRYVCPIVPIAMAVAAVGLDGVARFAFARIASRDPLRPSRERDRNLALLAATALIALGFGERAARFTFGDLGHGDGLAARLAGRNDSPWHAAEGVNRMLWAAGTAPDACGVVVADIPWSSTGAYAYLHKDVPLFFHLDDAAQANANYLIARRELARPWRYVPIAESRGFALFRREGPCEAPPASYTRVMPP